MRTRLFCFLAFVAYVNTIFHQEGHTHGWGTDQIIDGAPLVEIILEDVLEIPCSDNESLSDDFQYDDYRPASSKWLSIVPPEKEIGLSPLQTVDIFQYITRLELNTKITCLLGYYSFLFRLKPF
ncbi:hypothetical protein ACFOET_19215 [Parapedobacter deserti]|uniref:Uncharacterized protein n=1 Tax=Parapedobacter deserti TaxID=1912957 RepID=A0ABV7JRE4_9SPHI